MTRGPWSPHKNTLHINCLELLAATLAVQTFAKQRQGISILLKIDNITAVAYINRRGGTLSPLLSQLAKDLWLWCMNRNIYLQAQHLRTREDEHRSQQGVQVLVRQIRMEALTENQCSLGPSSDGSVCEPPLNTTPNICQLETRSPGYRSRCIHVGLAQLASETLRKSPLESDRQSPVIYNPPGNGRSNSGGTSLESSALVPTTITQTGQDISTHTSLNRGDPTNLP